jgi:serine O-acetyltransferase
MNTRGKEDLVQIVDNIMASYKEIGGINHIMGPNLPSRNSVGRILNEIESLIFPGFVEMIGVDQESLGYHTAECAYRIAKDLIT